MSGEFCANEIIERKACGAYRSVNVGDRYGRRWRLPAGALDAVELQWPRFVFVALPPNTSDLCVAVEPKQVATDTCSIQFKQFHQRARFQRLDIIGNAVRHGVNTC